MGYTAVSLLTSLALFVLAGVFEIGGGWLVWKWRKDGWHWVFFVLGSGILVAYGIVPTLQEQPFGRTYAAYGGFFVLLSFLWGWSFDGQQPDKWDWIGSAIAVAGVCVIMFVPRSALVQQDEAAVPSMAAAPGPA
eukprot:TRINITY_DN16061_c0_g1_i1.p1 TRINITY_DN16061_c0_g1~~TRINITY_DN16061_c0_g1_i1.p1  ORF type:complete len:135 (+),score=22.70 TRINITY_DN16061_c0_g1_i1:157-561(+)